MGEWLKGFFRKRVAVLVALFMGILGVWADLPSIGIDPKAPMTTAVIAFVNLIPSLVLGALLATGSLLALAVGSWGLERYLDWRWERPAHERFLASDTLIEHCLSSLLPDPPDDREGLIYAQLQGYAVLGAELAIMKSLFSDLRMWSPSGDYQYGRWMIYLSTMRIYAQKGQLEQARDFAERMRQAASDSE